MITERQALTIFFMGMFIAHSFHRMTKKSGEDEYQRMILETQPVYHRSRPIAQPIPRVSFRPTIPLKWELENLVEL